MPITKSAIKKQRADKTRAEVNKVISSRAKSAVRKAKAEPSSQTLAEAYSALDVAVKKHVLRLNTVSRIKAGIAKLAKLKATASK